MATPGSDYEYRDGSGYYRMSDRSGPYAWDGSSMYLMSGVSNLTAAQVAALKAAGTPAPAGTTIIDPVSGAVLGVVDGSGGLLYFGAIVNEAPNTVVNAGNTGVGTTSTQIALITVPGGLMGLKTKLLLTYNMDMSGADSKDVIVRAGPSSGTYATATGFSGQSGLTTQVEGQYSAFIWNVNSLSVQRATPLNQPQAFHSGGTAAAVNLAIDTSLDWNIYIGVKANAATVLDVFTLRHYDLQVWAK